MLGDHDNGSVYHPDHAPSRSQPGPFNGQGNSINNNAITDNATDITRNNMGTQDEPSYLLTSDHLHVPYSSEGNTDNLSNNPAITSSIIIPCTNIKAIKHGLNNRAITLPNKYATTIRDTITSTTIIHLNAGIIILIVMMVNP